MKKLLRFIKTNSEFVKIVFAIIAAIWIIWEFYSKDKEASIARSVEYIKKFTEGEFLKSELIINKHLLSESFKEKRGAIKEGDRVAFSELMIRTVEQQLFDDVWRTFNFYKSMTICVNAKLCDRLTACKYFLRDLKIFESNFGAYFRKYSEKNYDDAFAPIRTFLQHPDCA